ncbi:MAG TPA: bifunctional hydroxymethylpyrimidine kinase/phosphomethylpyrimidine kinase [Thermomicrobiales bacterium]|nr:bifunctional hydroxymethylpyrimidine kinase/phosphomethylpyrimidine kinase [Thermomicrobiales bacterium]
MSDNGNGQIQQSTKDQVLVPEEDRPRVPKAMTVATSDSGAGAGIQADLKTFAAHGVYGTSTVVAITAQSTKGVYAIAEVPDEVIVAQIDMMMEDIGADAAKTGMLSSRLIVEVVADRLNAWGVPTVVDPVMVAKSGDQLLQPNAVAAYKRHLLPTALVVTPNIPEAEVLSGITITDEASLREAGRAIAALGPKWVLLKGGHRAGPPVDLLFNGTDFTEFEAERIPGYNTHGTGCTLSAAITANLTLGHNVPEAVEASIAYLHGAMRAGYAIGGGHSPVNHFYRHPEMGPSAAQGTASRRLEDK